MIKNSKFKIKNSSRAFSLPEVIVTMFIFVIMMLVVTSVFATMIKARKQARDMQKRMENIRYAVELMAKNIRMSSVDSAGDNEIYIYNHSQGKCMHFQFVPGSPGKLFLREALGARETLLDCSSGTVIYSDLTELALEDISNVQFVYTQLGSSSLGRVTISMAMTGEQESAQTTVALRDYSSIRQ